MRLDQLLGFNNMQLPVVIEESVQCLKNFTWCQVQLVKNYPVAFSHRFNQYTFLENKLAAGWVRDIRPQILLDISVHMVVNSYHSVVCHRCQIVDAASFACRRRSLQNHRKVRHTDNRCQLLQKMFKTCGQDELIHIESRWLERPKLDKTVFYVCESFVFLVLNSKFGKTIDRKNPLNHYPHHFLHLLIKMTSKARVKRVIDSFYRGVLQLNGACHESQSAAQIS